MWPWMPCAKHSVCKRCCEQGRPCGPYETANQSLEFMKGMVQRPALRTYHQAQPGPWGQNSGDTLPSAPLFPSACLRSQEPVDESAPGDPRLAAMGTGFGNPMHNRDGQHPTATHMELEPAFQDPGANPTDLPTSTLLDYPNNLTPRMMPSERDQQGHETFLCGDDDCENLSS